MDCFNMYTILILCLLLFKLTSTRDNSTDSDPTIPYDDYNEVNATSMPPDNTVMTPTENMKEETPMDDGAVFCRDNSSSIDRALIHDSLICDPEGILDQHDRRRVSQSISHVCLDIPCPCVTCSIYGGLVITVLIISQDNTTIQTDRHHSIMKETFNITHPRNEDCDNDLLVVLYTQQKEIFTSTGPNVSLNAECISRIHQEANDWLIREQYATALNQIILAYRAVLTGKATCNHHLTHRTTNYLILTVEVSCLTIVTAAFIMFVYLVTRLYIHRMRRWQMKSQITLNRPMECKLRCALLKEKPLKLGYQFHVDETMNEKDKFLKPNQHDGSSVSELSIEL